MKIPITRPQLDAAEEAAVLEVLRSGWVAQGPRVAEFETALAMYTDARFAVATTSCTTALHLILAGLGIGAGDEVIVPAFTFVATANVVECAGATPVFADIDPRTFNLAVEDLDRRVSARTRALVVVHLFGLSADLDPILALGRRHGLVVLEDAACALGTRYHNRHAGTGGTAGAFSFHPRKVITTGEGGAVTTDDPVLAERLQVLRNHGGRVSDLERHRTGAFTLPEYDEVGFNYRMTDLQAALGIVQLAKADRLIAARQRLAQRYTEAFGDFEGLATPVVPPGCVHTYQSYVCLVGEEAPVGRDELAEALGAEGIAVRQGTHAVHALGYYRRKYGLEEGDYPNASRADRRSLTLPLYPDLSTAEQDQVIEGVRRCWGRSGG
ncbi:MAG: DegT/DnrJ/EryC1/StrS family aminotransferase [Candidatus Rokuibacteriota bacterium]